MKFPKLALSLALFLSIGLLAQQSGEKPTAPTPTTASATDDISGMYSFLRDGEFVQITVEEAGVSGFVSRYGDSDSDKGTFLDQFFNKAALKDKHLTFTTKKVHGVWFDFDGTVETVAGKNPHDEGYRIIRGKLTEYSEDANGKDVAKSRQIEMKSFPQDLDEDEQPKKP